MFFRYIFAFTFAAFLYITSPANAERWTYGSHRGEAMVCVPKGTGPFPTVIFNHGKMVDELGVNEAAGKGYDLHGICKAFAEEGYLAFMPIRQHGYENNRQHIENLVREVSNALMAAKEREDVDSSRIAFGGFSRGGFLTLLAGIRGIPVNALFILAPGMPNAFSNAVKHVGQVRVPVLAMIAKNDDLYSNITALEEAMNRAGKTLTLYKYDRGGHELFWTKDYYWTDLIEFLKSKLANNNSTAQISSLGSGRRPAGGQVAARQPPALRMTPDQIRELVSGKTLTFIAPSNGQQLKVYFAPDGVVQMVGARNPKRIIRKSWFVDNRGLLCRKVGRQNKDHCTRVKKTGDRTLNLSSSRMGISYDATIVEGLALDK